MRSSVNTDLIDGFGGAAYGIAASGSDLFIPDQNNNLIAEYTTAGSVVNADFVTGLDDPTGIALGDVKCCSRTRFAGPDCYLCRPTGPAPAENLSRHPLPKSKQPVFQEGNFR
jgi:hypothetical protein